MHIRLLPGNNTVKCPDIYRICSCDNFMLWILWIMKHLLTGMRQFGVVRWGLPAKLVHFEAGTPVRLFMEYSSEIGTFTMQQRTTWGSMRSLGVACNWNPNLAWMAKASMPLPSPWCDCRSALVQSDTADAQNRSWDAMGHNTASYLLEATGKGTKASSAMRVVCWENIWRDNFDFSVQIEKKGRAKSVLHQTNNPGLESGNLGTCIYRAGNAWES